MQKLKKYGKKIIACSLALTILGGILPQDIFSGLSGIFSPLFANAAEDVIAPECEFIDELYDGSNAISPLPSIQEYANDYSYQAPKRISLTGFRAICLTQEDFNVNLAQSYMTDEYKLMICDAEELYQYSQIVNGYNSTSAEIDFYLSASIVLGNNIEYSSIGSNKRFLPIGNESNKFTGTFDGQNFEIRNLYLSETYTPATVAFFGAVAEGATVKNFGIYHPTYLPTQNSSLDIAAVVSQNYGTVENVYAIVQEYKDSAVSEVQSNVIKSSNAANAAGLVAVNHEGATLKNSYFAGTLDSSSPNIQNPVCASNSGTVTNCYYDKEVFAYGTAGEQTDEVSGEITGLSNIDLKKLNGVTNTDFKPIRLKNNTSTTQNEWSYPRLYGFEGSGTQSNPYLISTAADLIYFPFSYEYCIDKVYFALEKCIDMSEVAPNAYKPNLDFTFSTNYILNGQVVKKEYTYTNRYFYGVLDGVADNDEDCCLKHVENMGNDSEGEPLQECHIIYNLTIDTPATTAADGYQDVRYTALIAKVNGNKNPGVTFNPTVENIHFVGGEISSGDTDCMPENYSSDALNVKTATVVAKTSPTVNGYMAYLKMTNVHSSATVKIGTGKQCSVAVGGLAADGAVQFITDCTNSGDIIGGYINVPDDVNITGEKIYMGGLLGNCKSTTQSGQYCWWGKITHCANYGNIYGAVLISDDNKRVLTKGEVKIAGISTNTLGTTSTNTIEEPKGVDRVYINDSNRMNDVANFGMLFDGPVETDTDGDPIDVNGNKITKQTNYETEQPMPKAVPLSEDKYIVNNNSSNYNTYIYGIGYNIISHAYNEGDIYSIMIEKVSIAGIGYMNTAYNSNLNQYYNYMNYNAGNVYMYKGALEASGIADQCAYKSYNEGNIFLYNGVIMTNGIGNDNAGCFSGISGLRSGGCYNKGNIYLAPSARAAYTGTSENKVISVAGASQNYGNEITETDTIKNINAGTLIVDLKKNNFDATLNTETGSTNYFVTFYMMGTGVGKGNLNYGKFNFITNKNNADEKVKLSIAGCGGLYGSVINIDECINYSDINITAEEGCLYDLSIRGIGKTTTISGFADCINYGDINFTGDLSNSLNIYTIGDQSVKAQKNINLGNVAINPNSTVNKLKIYTYCSYDGTENMSSIMNGWYSGCTVPSELDTEENRAIFNELEQDKRYGTVTVSGENIKVTTMDIAMFNFYRESAGLASGEYIKNMVNNGKVIVSGIELAGQVSVYGLSNGYITDSENHAPITFDNNLFSSDVFISGASAGKRNVNYADITVKNCVTRSTAAKKLLVYGVAYNSSVVSDCLENQGDIIIDNLRTATVNGTKYTAPSVSGETNVYDTVLYASGIGKSQIINNSANFGNIEVSDVAQYYIGGITPNRSAVKSINYGDIICNNSGGLGYIGGIVAYGNSAKNCENFGNISLKNPTSYYNSGIYIGGICGNNTINSGIYSSANYGKIIYNNDRGINTENASQDNTKTGTVLHIGGVSGNIMYGSVACYIMNYGDIVVENEPNMIVRAGGILGYCKTNQRGSKELLNGSSYSMINYGDITVPYSTNPSQNIETGGILGYMDSNWVENSNMGCYYGINYGTVMAVESEGKEFYPDITYTGSIVGYTNGPSTKFIINKFVDLSNPPDGAEKYPLAGGFNVSRWNDITAVNYTKNEASITIDKTNERFRTIKTVTLDDNEETGVFSYNFVLRSDLYCSYDKNNQQNGLVYQDFDKLSPYLQTYMVEHFGENIKNYGAYVMLNVGVNELRSLYSYYFPGKIDEELEEYRGYEGYYYFGCTDNYDDPSLINDNNIDELYAQNTPVEQRTIRTDMEYYAQQVQSSSLPEVYSVSMQTSEKYLNVNTDEEQIFRAYDNPVVRITPVSDTVEITNIEFFVNTLDIDTTANDNTLSLTVNVNSASVFSNMVFYTGDYIAENPTIYYTYPYNEWLNESNIIEQLEITGNWSESYDTDSTAINNLLNENWVIDIPFKRETANEDMETMYTKVLGVVTAEDGVHRNIVVIHVILESMELGAELTSVTLNTPSDGTFTSTIENGYMISEPGHESETDTDDEGNPKTDIIYYYLSDESSVEGQDILDLEGQNIQKYNFSSKLGPPTLEITTHNMDNEGEIYVRITRQDQIPVGNQTYNDLRWNPNVNNESSAFFTKSLSNVTTDPITHQSVGTVTFELNATKLLSDTKETTDLIFYGGLYRIDLYYERTLNSHNAKHFATVFIVKEYSPVNTNNNMWHNINPTDTYDSQKDYDLTHPLIDGIAQGYFSAGIYPEKAPSIYNYEPETGSVKFPYYTRISNDSANGEYYALKGYIGNGAKTEITLGKDNIGGAVTKTLYNQLQSIHIYQDDETGAFYPVRYKTEMDIMAENGDVRRYTYDLVHYGYFREDNSEFCGTPPTISVSSINKNGVSFSGNSGTIYGDEENNITFTCKWSSSNVIMSLAKDSGEDGYSAERVKVLFTPYTIDNSSISRELTSTEINEYFIEFSVNASNQWTFTLSENAPLGEYKIVPYMNYTTNFNESYSEYVDDHIELYTGKISSTDKITLINDDDIPLLADGSERREGNKFVWTIPYEAFTIKNIPNDDSYITSFDVNNDIYNPFMEEGTTAEDEELVEGSENRYIYINPAFNNGDYKIEYYGYEDVREGNSEQRVDKFIVYSYVAKGTSESNITVRTPYRATLLKWTGTGSPFDAQGNLVQSAENNWVSAEENETNISTINYRQYQFSVDYTLDGSTTYYKAVAEDGITSTVYTVNIVLSKRNKETSLEIAQKSELDSISSNVDAMFEESDKIYKEILEKYGQVSATVKELNMSGESVDAYQTKIFDGISDGDETEPYIYNLKSYRYDISMELPSGYTYDVLLFSQNMDKYQTLRPSENGFNGKQLIISSSTDQTLNIRIVLRRETLNTIWGVQYIWTLPTAATDENGYVKTEGGGIFNNYIYNTTS